MKFFLLASFALVCAATTVYSIGNIAVNDDGSYVITSPYGRQVLIQGPTGVAGQRYFQLTVSGPNVPSRTVEVSESAIGQQASVIAEIIREYQGAVDQVQYERFLNRIRSVSPKFYQFLQTLDQQVYGQQYYGPYAQQHYGQYAQQYYGPYAQQYYGPYAQQYQQQYGYGYQYPSSAYYNQYYGSRYANPLVARIFGNQNNYFTDLLANQQQYYGVPQNILARFFGRQQQYPYGQYYGQQVYGQQQVGQYYGQQQLNQVEQAVEYQQEQQQQQQQQNVVAQLAGVYYPYGQQYSSVPTYLRQLFGQYGRNYPQYYYNQQPFYDQNTVPQPQVVY